MLQTRWPLAPLLTAAVFSAACGGTVIIADDGDGGAGNAGATGGTGGSGNAGNAGATGGSGNAGATGGTGGSGNAGNAGGTGGGPTDVLAACQALCAAAPACSEGGNCVAECTSVPQLCPSEFAAAVQCFAAFVDPVSCSVDQDECLLLIDAWNQCENGTGACEENGCFGGPGGQCGCSGVCNGMNLATDCKPAANGTLQCACTIDGNLAGQCQSDFDACGIFDSCCAGIFFGGPVG